MLLARKFTWRLPELGMAFVGHGEATALANAKTRGNRRVISWCVLMPRKLASGCTGSNRLGQFDRTLHRHVNSSGLAPETVNRS
jgi:hypothetical protein